MILLIFFFFFFFFLFFFFFAVTTFCYFLLLSASFCASFCYLLLQFLLGFFFLMIFFFFSFSFFFFFFFSFYFKVTFFSLLCDSRRSMSPRALPSATLLTSWTLASMASRNLWVLFFFWLLSPSTLLSPPSASKTLSDLVSWKCLQGKVEFFSKAKTFIGFRVAKTSWNDCFVGVSSDAFYFFKSVDEVFAPPSPWFLFPPPLFLLTPLSCSSWENMLTLFLSLRTVWFMTLGCTRENHFPSL